jgi:hypothetical protein
MNYEAFKSAFMTALQQSRLPVIGIGGEERIDPRSLGREFVVYVEPIGRGLSPPLRVSGSISFRWDALLTARMATREEDLLTELHGRDSAEGINTDQPWVRVDIVLRAGLEWGKSLPMPDQAAWAGWIHETRGRLEEVERIVSDDVVREIPGRLPAVLAWQGDPEIKLRCEQDGGLRLEEIRIAAFQGIEVPRQWDDPEREPDDDPSAALIALFERVRAALHAWSETADHLLPIPAP